VNNARAWWLVAGSLILAFLARGPLYLSVLPPFEGWDEYQHLAYIAHLDETGSIPVAEESTRVSTTLRPLVAALPHPQSGVDQLAGWGAVSYDNYWNTARAIAGADRQWSPPPRLYQAQQPPLAYVLAWPLWHALKTTHALEAIYAIRAMNLLLVATSLVLFAGALTRLVPSFAPRVAVFALVCLHPLFFQNAARVANDALALAAGVAGISMLVLADGRTLLARGLLAATCIAASVWTKQTSLTLIPALILGPPLIGWAHGVQAGRLWRVTGLAAVAFVLLWAPLWVWNYQHYGTTLTTQDSVELAARGSGVATLAASFVNVPWGQVVEFLFVPGRPWVGGWSFLPIEETLRTLYGWYWGILLAGALAGAVVAILRRPRSVEAVGRLGLCAIVVIFTALGIMYYAVVSHAVFGRPMANPWYFMTALPFLFVLLVRGLEAIDRRMAVAAAAGLAALFVAIDVHGTWIQMPAFYASSPKAAIQWARLTQIHPAALSGDLRWWFLATQLGALCLVAGALAHAWRSRAR